MRNAGDDSTDRGKLGRSLRVLRDAANLRQVDAAAQVGITQAKLSRFEQGRALLEPGQVDALLRLYQAPDAEREILVDLAQIVEDDYADERVVFQSGSTANLQRRFAELEDNASHVRAYQPVVVIGAMQTPAYAACVLGVDEDHPLVAQRIARQQRMLNDPGRRWTFVQTEGSLRWQARSAEVMAEQVEHLIEVSHAPNVDLGIVDWRTPVEIFPNTSFHIYDESAVVVGTRDGTSIMRGAKRLADYRGMFDEVARLASFGDDGRAALSRIADEYRSLI